MQLHTLLPIKRPLEDDYFPPDNYFYNNVASHLITDIVKLEASGIPINLDKVKEVENVVDEVLTNVDTVLTNNTLIHKYLQKVRENQQAQIQWKNVENYRTKFNPNNKIHLSYVINTFLQNVARREDLVLKEWDKSSIKLVSKLVEGDFKKIIDDIQQDNYEPYVDIIDMAMGTLAKDKCELANKKIKEREAHRPLPKFNPASPKQKRDFLNMLDIHSETFTDTGEEKWDREALENLLVKIDNEIFKLENTNDK